MSLRSLFRSAPDVRDLAFLAGLALVSAGAWMVHEAAGLIVPGVILIWQTTARRVG